MDKINGIIENKYTAFSDFKNFDGQEVTVCGYIHRIREMTGFSFVIIRTATDTVQCVYAPEFSDYRWDEKLCEEACVRVTGKVVMSLDAKATKGLKFKSTALKFFHCPPKRCPS